MILEKIERPLYPAIINPYQRQGEGLTPPPEVPEISFFQWGKPGEFGEFEEEAAKLVGGSTVETRDPKDPPKSETYSFKEIERHETPYYITAANGLRLKYKHISWIIFEGPKRIRGGVDKPDNSLDLDGQEVFSQSGGGSDESKDQDEQKQLYKFVFTTPDPWTGIVQLIETSSDED